MSSNWSRNRLFASGLMFGCCILLSGWESAAAEPAPQAMKITELIDFIRPGIFRIETTEGTGSGFVIQSEPELTKEGKLTAYLVTNAHVIGTPPSGLPDDRPIKISGGWAAVGNESSPFFGLDASLVGYDELTDLAVIRAQFFRQKSPSPFATEARPEEFGIKVLKWADPRTMRVGEDVVAVGFPRASVIRELEPTVTDGILSAKNRSFFDGGIADLLQTNAAISAGNSGGPLLNRRGEVLGVNTYSLTTPLSLQVDVRKVKAFLDDPEVQQSLADPQGAPLVLTITDEVKLTQGMFFARSCNTAAPFVASLIQHGELPRAYLGCKTTLVKGPDADKTGLFGWVVSEIEKGSPAEGAGLQELDMLREMGGMSVLTVGELLNALALLPRGQELELKFMRPSPRHIESLRAGKGVPPWEIYQDFRTAKITLQ